MLRFTSFGFLLPSAVPSSTNRRRVPWLPPFTFREVTACIAVHSRPCPTVKSFAASANHSRAVSAADDHRGVALDHGDSVAHVVGCNATIRMKATRVDGLRLARDGTGHGIGREDLARRRFAKVPVAGIAAGEYPDRPRVQAARDAMPGTFLR